jgi:cell wall-associated NlpC family hydrolase
MSHTLSELRPAPRSTVHTTPRLIAVVGLMAGLVLAVLATAPSAHAAPRGHHRHHHHVVRHHHHVVRHHHQVHHHRHHAVLGAAAGRVAHAMGVASAQRGKPYVYGAAGPRAFDCSGLTSFAFHHAGFGAMPRTAAAQAHFARHISRGQMRRGDLIFFTGGGGVYHVGLYAGFFHGHRMVLHAPYPGQRVRVQPLWTNAWFPGTLRFR